MRCEMDEKPSSVQIMDVTSYLAMVPQKACTSHIKSGLPTPNRAPVYRSSPSPAAPPRKNLHNLRKVAAKAPCVLRLTLNIVQKSYHGGSGGHGGQRAAPRPPAGAVA
jgi:hypothetical protein